jgi:hypothetical protein
MPGMRRRTSCFPGALASAAASRSDPAEVQAPWAPTMETTAGELRQEGQVLVLIRLCTKRLPKGNCLPSFFSCSCRKCALHAVSRECRRPAENGGVQTGPAGMQLDATERRRRPACAAGRRGTVCDDGLLLLGGR